jgi:choline-sulfatase
MIFKLGNSYQPGTTSDALIEYIDIVPTIVDLIQAHPVEQAQGLSFQPTLKDLNQPDKSVAFSEYLHDNMAMVCTDKWKYVFTTGSRDLGIGYQTGYGPSGIVHRLYDLKNDPGEQHSVAHLTENATVLAQLQQQMLDRFLKTHPDSASCPRGLTLEGKLVWFCEPRDIGFDQLLEDYPIRVFKE